MTVAIHQTSKEIDEQTKPNQTKKSKRQKKLKDCHHTNRVLQKLHGTLSL